MTPATCIHCSAPVVWRAVPTANGRRRWIPLNLITAGSRSKPEAYVDHRGTCFAVPRTAAGISALHLTKTCRPPRPGKSVAERLALIRDAHERAEARRLRRAHAKRVVTTASESRPVAKAA